MRRCSSSFGTPTRIDDFAKTRRSAAREGIVSSGSFREPSEGEAVVRRDYETADVTVHWDSTRCVHSGICLKSLPDVFDTQRRPWVDVAAASAGEIVAAIERCPSGALTYTPAAGPGEQPDVPTTVIPWPNGPLWVRGDVEVRDRSGNLFRAGPRVALCRCGHSLNQPFCDMSHRTAGFRDNPHAIDPARDAAETPSEIGESHGS